MINFFTFIQVPMGLISFLSNYTSVRFVHLRVQYHAWSNEKDLYPAAYVQRPQVKFDDKVMIQVKKLERPKEWRNLGFDTAKYQCRFETVKRRDELPTIRIIGQKQFLKLLAWHSETFRWFKDRFACHGTTKLEDSKGSKFAKFWSQKSKPNLPVLNSSRCNSLFWSVFIISLL